MASSVLGIDPGLSGGWAIYNLDTGHIQVGDLPTSGTASARVIEGAILAELIEANDIESAAVELVGPMPTDGPQQAFRFGQSTGEVIGVIKGMRIPLFRASPQKWKKHFGLIGKDKEASRQLAIQRFPKIAGSLTRKMDQGRAEALLIAVHHIETRTDSAFAIKAA